MQGVNPVNSEGSRERAIETRKTKPKCHHCCKRLISITLILPLFVVSLVLLTSGAVFGLTYYNSVRSVDDLSNSLSSELGRRIQGRVESLFDEPPKILQLMRTLVLLGHVFVSNATGMEFSEENYFNTKIFLINMVGIYPDVAVIYFGNEFGDMMGIEAVSEDVYVEISKQSFGKTRYHWQVTPETTLDEYCKLTGGNDTLKIYLTRANGTRYSNEPIQENCGWTAQIRGWYLDAQMDRVSWSDVYIFGDGALGITASLMIAKDNGFIGVAGVDYKLETLNTFLRTITVGRNGVAFLMTDNGGFLASSNDDQVPQETEGEILSQAIDTADPLIAQAALLVLQRQFTDSIRFKGKAGGRGCFIQAENLNVAESLNWMIVIVLPEEDVLSDIWIGNIITISATTGIVLVSIFAALLITFLIIYPLFRLGSYMNRVAKMDFNFKQRWSMFYEIRTIQNRFFGMTVALQYVNRFVPSSIIREILSDENADFQLRPVNDMTILFCDLVKFTDMCSMLAPKELLYVMEYCMEELSTCITDSHGVIDKYIGDALMCLFNPSVHALENHASYAIEASIACHQRLKCLEESNHWTKFKIDPITCRVGINSGNALVGVFGSSQRLSYTSLGDSTNLAARLEPLCSAYSVGTLISGDTWERAKDFYCCRCLDLIVVKGRTELTPIFEPLCTVGEASDEQRRVQNASLSMLNALQKGKRNDALVAVDAILKIPGYGDDFAVKQMEMRLRNASNDLFQKYSVKSVSGLRTGTEDSANE